MDEISKVVLAKAIVLLKALKAEYVIQIPDEPIINEGSIEIAEPRNRKRRTVTAPHGTYRDFLMNAGFDAMQPGDVMKFEPGELHAESIRKSAVARGCHQWGNGSIMSTIKDNVVEVMRLQ